MQRARFILIFGGLVAVFGGGLYYLLGVHLPGRSRGAAQAEIEQWEVRFEKVRACLFGTAPPSPNADEALAIRELAGDSNHRMCTSAIGELTRGIADATGIAAVETAWRTIDRAAAGVATSFASGIDRGGPAPTHRTANRLSAAFDALADAHRVLREAASMDPPPAPPGKPLPAAELVSLGPIKVLAAWLQSSSGGMIVHAHAPHDIQLHLVPGEAPVRAPMADLTRPSVADPTWGATAAGRDVVFGTIDATGNALAGARWTAPKGLDPSVLFVLGTAKDGLAAVVLGDGDAMQVAIVRVAGGTVTAERGHAAAEYSFTIDPRGQRGLLAWSKAGALHGAIVRAGTPTKIVELGSGHAGPACLAALHGWVSSGDQFVSFDDAGARPHVLPQHTLLGCGEAGALLRRAGHRYTVCTKTCRIVDLAAGPLAAAAIAGPDVIAVGSKQRVLAVWRERGGPLYFTLPTPLTPMLVHATAKVVDVIGSTPDGALVIARVPL